MFETAAEGYPSILVDRCRAEKCPAVEPVHIYIPRSSKGCHILDPGEINASCCSGAEKMSRG